MPNQDILVCSENISLLRELLGKASVECGVFKGEVKALYLGKETVEAASLAAAGATTVLQIESGTLREGDVESVTSLLSSFISASQPALILMGATKLAMEIAPRVAERTQAAYAASVTNFSINEATHAVKADCMLYAGLGVDTLQFKPHVTLLTVVPGAFSPIELPSTTIKVESLSLPATSNRIEITAYKPKTGSSTRVEEAKAIIDVGQGIKQKEDLQFIHELADLLDGLVTCTRPLAADRDWFPEWLGLSGKKVSPELCLTIGISGAVQHIVGVRDSHIIVAVNNDENAGVFLDADYGVIADLYEFIPALRDRLKARGISPIWAA